MSSLGTKKRKTDDISAEVSDVPDDDAAGPVGNEPSRKSDVLVGEEEDVLTNSTLPLRLAVLGGYLPLRDTGRFLLRVGKDTTAAIFEERVSLGDGEGAVPNDGSEATDTEANTISLRQEKARNETWKFLCEQKWKTPSTLEHLVSVLYGSSDGSGRPSAGEIDVTTRVWEKLFRKFLPSPPKPTVSASVEDYSFVFTLKKCDESERDFTVPLITFVLKGDDAVKFLRTGQSGWLELDSPFLLGNFERDAFQNMLENQSQNMISTLHVLRKSDGKSTELVCQQGLDIPNISYYRGVEEDKIEIGFGDDFVNTFNDLETIITNQSANGVGILIERNLRITASKKCSGSTEYMCEISHIGFDTWLFMADGGYAFDDPSIELATGVTVADFLSRFDDWE